MGSDFSRRYFFLGTAAALAAARLEARSTPSLKRLGYKSPNEKLNIAGIGAGGKGHSDIVSCSAENIVALADPDWNNAARTFKQFPKATQYKDYRVLFDKERDNIDAVTVSTPDHTHAVAAMWAMERGKHVYCQKPLTRTVYEARMLRDAARKYKVATQMGNQGHSNEGARQLCEMIWAGEIGAVQEVHAWTDRPIWPQGVDHPLPEEKVPDTLDWDLWLGTAPTRPYNSKYEPFNWRGWYDFGCGALGDMACHILDGVNWSLLLDAPTSVECIRIEGRNDYTFPTKSIVRFDFGARANMPPVSVYWYEGGLKPKLPEGLPADVKLGDLDDDTNGSLFIGEKGFITTGTYSNDTRLVPDSRMKDYKFPPKLLTRSPGHSQDWIRACKGGERACSNFDYAAPFAEWVVLGVIAQRSEGKLEWDSAKMKITNNSAANKFLKPSVRKGWKY